MRGATDIIAIRLRCEYLKNPMGIDDLKPRLMWNCEGGMKQTAYEIVTDNWQSGKVESKWNQTERGYTFEITVPANCEARVCLPDDREFVQAAGRMIYTIEEKGGKLC